MLYILDKFQAPPESLSVIIGDVIQNLRGALVHVAYLLFNGKPGFKPGSSFFPIAESSTKYVSESLGKIKGFWQDGIDAINLVEPYGGGKGEILWKLHRLSITDKHRLLLTVISQYRSHKLNPFLGTFEDLCRKMGHNVDIPEMFLTSGAQIRPSQSRNCPVRRPSLRGGEE